MKNNFLLFTLIIIMSVSCKKADDYIFVGTITNALTGEPVSGESVEVLQYINITSVPKNIGTVTTASDGKYYVKTKRVKTSKFVINVSQNGYFSKSSEVNVNTIKVGENISDFFVNSIGYIKFVIKHLTVNSNDQFKIFRQGSNTSCDECCSAGASFIYGSIDTVFYCPANAGSSFKFDWFINASQAFGSENYIIPAFDTITFTKIY
jgi:hypothetical protein